jgi:hypothetical protein
MLKIINFSFEVPVLKLDEAIGGSERWIGLELSSSTLRFGMGSSRRVAV